MNLVAGSILKHLREERVRSNSIMSLLKARYCVIKLLNSLNAALSVNPKVWKVASGLILEFSRASFY